MRKIIAIGESSFCINFRDAATASGYPDGVIANASASLARVGMDVFMVSEAATDFFGDTITSFLDKAGVDTSSIDRFTEGKTALNIIQPKGSMLYEDYPAERFNVVWPRIDEDDIVVFGGFYALDNSLRTALFDMISYAKERKAVIVYLPGFANHDDLRITKVMTAILENLEVSDLVIAMEDDIKRIFNQPDSATAFKQNIEFYCPYFISVSHDGKIDMFANGELLTRNTQADTSSLTVRSALLAGIVYGIVKNELMHDSIRSAESTAWHDIVDNAADFAGNIDNETRLVSEQFASPKAQIVNNIQNEKS